jgi:hypothetical protein
MVNRIVAARLISSTIKKWILTMMVSGICLPANLFSGINRWSFDNGKGLMAQFGIKFLDDKKTGGQTGYNADEDKFTTNSYGLEINTTRAEAFAKIGYVFPQQKYKSIGLQLSAFNHEQDSYFGFTRYNGKQNNFYSNLYLPVDHKQHHT